MWTHWSIGPLVRAAVRAGGRIRGWAVSAGRARDSRGTGRSTRARAALQAAQPPHRATFVTRQACGAGIVLRRTAVADRSHDAPGPTGIRPIPRRGCYHWRVGRDADERLIIQRRGVSPRRREPKSSGGRTRWLEGRTQAMILSGNEICPSANPTHNIANSGQLIRRSGKLSDQKNVEKAHSTPLNVSAAQRTTTTATTHSPLIICKTRHTLYMVPDSPGVTWSGSVRAFSSASAVQKISISRESCIQLA